MNSQTVARRGSTAAHTVELAADRARQFANARRHSLFIRLLKIVLPSVAVLAMGVYGAALFATNTFKAKGVTHGTITIDPKNLTMETPKYDGFGKDGTHFIVRAREAVTDIRQSSPVRLNVIDGRITQTNGVATDLKANWGTYDQKQDILELYEKIDVDGSTGMKARLTRATVFPKESRIVSNEPVYVESESGNIRARQMTFNSRERKGTFAEDVQVRLKAPPPKPDAAGEEAKARSQTALPGLAANSGEPIDVRSERLDFDDAAKTAFFRENVVAKQGDAQLQAPELDVHYEGKATSAMDGSASKPQAKAGDATQQPDQQTKLKLIKARGGVLMTNKDDRAQAATLDYDAASEVAVLKGNVILTSGAERGATAAQAQFDQKQDTALLTGNVVVTQGKNVLKGQRLAVDRKAGTSRLDVPAGGRINTVFYQGDGKAQPGGKAAAKTAQDASAAAAASAALPFQFKSDPSQPIDIDADTLDVFDQKRQAIFKGNVVAKQGNFVVQTAQMTAHYTGQAGLASSGTPGALAKGKAGEGSQAAQLTKVEARQKVVVTGTDGQRAVGDWADFDVKANTVTMGGDVIVTQGPQGRQNVINGGKGDLFIIDMTTGLSRFVKPDLPQARVAPATSGSAPGSEGAATAKQGSERTRAVFYPPEKSGDSNKQLLPKKSKTGTSSWEATTTGAPSGEKR